MPTTSRPAGLTQRGETRTAGHSFILHPLCHHAARSPSNDLAGDKLPRGLHPWVRHTAACSRPVIAAEGTFERWRRELDDRSP